MPFTPSVASVIDKARQYEPIDPGQALDLFNEAHHYICSQNHFYPIQYGTILLTSGTQEYALSGLTPGLLKIWDAAYFTAATSWNPIYPTNVDSAYYDRGPAWWATTSKGQTFQYYERGGNIGFIPTPSVTSVAGYPFVMVQYSEIPIMGSDDTLPPVDTVFPWVFMMCELACLADPDTPVSTLAQDADFYHKKFEESMHYLRESVYGRVARDHARAATNIKRVRRA
jgi:hypothetical protein